ncbi:MAG: hypothetical protein HZB41_04895 [Ignavibacteriae bacterium]|nr:hypothetical protein [Ignavibacteriota bacterium]
MPKHFFALIVLIILLSSCGTTKIIDKNPPPYLPEIKLQTHAGEAVFNFNLTANKDESQDKFDFVNTITSVILEIINPEDSVIHKLNFGQLDLKGTTDKNIQKTLTVSGSVNWILPGDINLKELKFRFKIFAINKYYDMTKRYSDLYSETDEESPAITLEPFIENQTFNSAVFGVIAKRNKIIENEYLPTSETFRVDILNHKGAIVWSSGLGFNFLQVIKPVLPKSIGETYKYTVEWNGNSSNQIPLIPGVYTLRMTIPSKPQSYTASMTFKWKAGDNDK